MTSSRSLTLLVPPDAPVGLAERVGADVTVARCPTAGPLDPAASEAEFFVPPFVAPERLRQWFGELSRLQVVQTLSAGVDWIIDEVPHGVMLCSAKGVHDASVAEWVVAAILFSFKNLGTAVRAMAAARWDGIGQLRCLEGSTVLILGHGEVGSAVEARLRPFGAEVVRVARRPRRGVVTAEELPHLLPRVDVLVDLLPLAEPTRHAVDAPMLAALPDGALVVNAGRGATIDTDALVAEVERGRLQAVLDVTEPEPLPDTHPLWQLPNVLVTQHSAGSTTSLADKQWAMVTEQVERFRIGQPLLGRVSDGY